MMKLFEAGQEITTKIAGISGDYIFLDLNAKSEGILDRSEFAKEDGSTAVQVGDTVSVFFLKEENGELYFTTKIDSKKADAALIENAWKSGIPIDGHVEKEIKGGFEVKIGGARAFCPYSQMGYRQKEDSSFYIGKTLPFIIREYRDSGRSLLVSNRAYMEAEEKKKREAMRSVLVPGACMTATVQAIEPFGAFVDIGGVRALLPVSELSFSRVENPAELLSVGQEIRVSVLKADWEHDRISVSMKALADDPWSHAAQKYTAGSQWTGRVARAAEFGLFVELEPGIDGLVHVSELEHDGRSGPLRKRYAAGEKIAVAVKSVDTEKKRISLAAASAREENTYADSYLAQQKHDDGETYNPFAALLAKKK